MAAAACTRPPHPMVLSRADLTHEFRLKAEGYARIVGLDEAGRGAWAGPVVAGAVILPLERFDLLNVLVDVNDSKLLTPHQRETLVPYIIGIASASGVGHASHTEIDELGIVPATRLAMQRALDALGVDADCLLTDSMPMPDHDLPCTPLIKGDQKSLSIAAASILAKVTRDQFMDQLADVFPKYGFREHKGYGTELHRQLLRNFGPCAAHRMSFAPIRQLIEKNSTSSSRDEEV